VTDDLPADVETVLAQLFTGGQEALEREEIEPCREILDSAEAVIASKIPAGKRKERLRFGCERVRARLDDGESDVAAEYLAAMERRME
jgi:hypothetical protein